MPQLGDALITPLSATNANDAYGVFPGAGRQWPQTGAPEVYLRTVQVCHTATMYVTLSPGGSMTGALVLAPANPNRKKLTILNSGSVPLAIEHGSQGFNPNIPMSVTNNWDNVVFGTAAQGNQQPAAVYQEQLPVYCGPIMGAWNGVLTATGSVAVVVDYS